MDKPEQLRARAAEYGRLAWVAHDPIVREELEHLARLYAAEADKAEAKDVTPGVGSN
jgi:hypothetical protein